MSLLVWRISLFLFSLFPPFPSVAPLPGLPLVFALFPSIKQQPFHLRLSCFPDLSMQFSSHPAADGFGADLGFFCLPPYFERTDHLPPLSRECRTLLPKPRHWAPMVRECHQRLSHSMAWVRTPLGPQQMRVLPQCYTSSLLGELSAVINLVPICLKIGLRKMPGCLIFKLNV